MSENKQTDRTSLIISFVALAIAVLTFVFQFWQTSLVFRPKIAIQSTNVYNKEMLPDGSLDFGIQFNLENRGQIEARALKILVSVVVDNKLLSTIQSDVSNDLFPQDVFNRALSMRIPKSFFTAAGASSIIFTKNLYFKAVITYKKNWFGRHKQVFYLLWNKETNRFEHCEANDVSVINKATNN